MLQASQQGLLADALDRWGLGLGLGVAGRRGAEQVEDAVSVHLVDGLVLLRHDRVGDVHLELLQTHDGRLEGVACDQAVHIDDLFLAEAVCPIHRL